MIYAGYNTIGLTCDVVQFVLWRDVLEQHGKAPLHAMVGGGDQIYNDEVFSGNHMQEWLKSGRKVSPPFSHHASMYLHGCWQLCVVILIQVLVRFQGEICPPAPAPPPHPPPTPRAEVEHTPPPSRGGVAVPSLPLSCCQTNTLLSACT